MAWDRAPTAQHFYVENNKYLKGEDGILLERTVK